MTPGFPPSRLVCAASDGCSDTGTYRPYKVADETSSLVEKSMCSVLTLACMVIYKKKCD